MPEPPEQPGGAPRSSAFVHPVLDTFLVFLRLGCVAFGGPVAHLGYFQREIVERRSWCSEETYGEIIALTQSLPGPASSQTGFALGTLRAGLAGGFAAWLGFTLPSALLMLAYAAGAGHFTGVRAQALAHGLQLAAVAVVAQAVYAMQQRLARGLLRILIALAAAVLVFAAPVSWASIAAIALGAAIGWLLLREPSESPKSQSSRGLEARLPLSRGTGLTAAALFFLLLAAAFLIPAKQAPRATPSPATVSAAFYRSGALVFGGGHVVLPLLESSVVATGWVSQSAFLSGYGAAQAIPGPLFTFAAYLGGSIERAPEPSLYGVLALLSLFAPGLLAVIAVLPFWASMRANAAVQAALSGMNASVVGILLVALYRPLGVSAIHGFADALVAAAALILLLFVKWPSWAIVATAACVSVLLSL